MTGQGKFKALLQLIRFDKPIGTLLLLWPTLSALWIAAQGVPDGKLLVIFVLGTFLTRSAGCIINDFADRNVDGSVERTRNRPLVTGAVSSREAIALFLILMLFAFALVLMTNPLTVALSIVAVFLASTYPFMKRYTHVPQVVLGAAFSWGVPMAFAAQSGELPGGMWLLYVANLLWTVAYDTEYAMVDREDDLIIGIKSTAILFGRHDRWIIGMLQLATLAALWLTGEQFELGAAFWGALLLIAGLFCYHQYLIRDRVAASCFRAFLHNNWVGAALFAGVALHYAI